jgi:hypothetical protein
MMTYRQKILKLKLDAIAQPQEIISNTIVYKLFVYISPPKYVLLNHDIKLRSKTIIKNFLLRRKTFYYEFKTT